MINKRLKTIANFVSDNSNIIDVGCDHAYLSIYLVENKKNTRAIASDINEGPLRIAKSNVEASNLESLIKIKLGDGLEPIEEETDTVIISGMGGITIANMMCRKDKLKNISKIIISPNNEFYIVRKTLNENGYYVVDEAMVKDRTKYYPIIVFEKGQQKYTEDELLFGPILLRTKQKDFIEFYTFLKDNLSSYVKQLTDMNKKEKILEEIKRLAHILS